MSAIYLDHAARTPLDERVAAAMTTAYAELVGSPHNLNHPFGRRAWEAIEVARHEIACAIGARSDQIFFTSGATESNNLALLGSGATNRLVVTCVTEHASVLEPLEQLERAGGHVVRLQVDRSGHLDAETLVAATTSATQLVSLMWVNNELGTVHPVADLAARVRRPGLLFHVDAAQAFGRVPMNVTDAGVDLVTLSAHKAGGPSGIGALFVRDARLLHPMLFGGGQQTGLRPGSLPTALCVGFGVAARRVREELTSDGANLTRSTSRLRTALQQRIGALTFLTPVRGAAPGILSVAFDGAAAEDVLALVGDELAIAAGSACSTGNGRPSHVLEALPVSPSVRHNTLRLSPGRGTTDAELDRAVEVLASAIALLRGLSDPTRAIPSSSNVLDQRGS